MGIAFLFLGLLLAADAPSWVVMEGDVELDWSLGALTTRGAAAADLRMPGPNSSRPGAERRAIASASERFRQTLRSFLGRPGESMLATGIQAALDRAKTTRIEYQSNGGVVLWRRIHFADLGPGKPSTTSTVAISVPSMPFRVAPAIQTGNRQVLPSYALYRRTPAPAHALTARWDALSGLILTQAPKDQSATLAGAVVEIFIQKLEP